ncbi:MAG: class I SAM-dependent methyltransferase [Candidatus Eremiobacteraeota bacterium]|nr:class I SAM-dependent methyltransferase [Candidatus Eremiobacteraeota bacterium]MBV8721112.1 class I SAM-dependent methyltransferase [Candidatus Eremiobacteraeota bacterium]
MTTERAVYTIDEFEREAAYLETIVWESLAIESGMKVLFCGYGDEGAEIKRALDAGAVVTVIEHRDTAINRFANLGAKLLRGSTSVIPAKENAFDLAVAFHYLHEIDPFFHAQVTSELARVGRRVAVVEPAPPADPLGKRIALLYSQAKRELGQFEYYQPMEYWKKLLQAVKADISQHVFAFAKVPPHEYLIDTIDLLLKTIEVEEAPKSFIDELRQIARRSDAQLLPPPRFVLVGAALGELPVPHFSERPAPKVEPPKPAAAIAAKAPVPAPATAPAPAFDEPRVVSADAGYEFPPVEVETSPRPPAPPAGPAKAPSEPAPEFVPGLPFGAPRPPEPARPESPPQPTPFGAPFAMPAPDPFGAPPQGIPPSTTWQWEPPEGGDDEPPFGPPPGT